MEHANIPLKGNIPHVQRFRGGLVFKAHILFLVNRFPHNPVRLVEGCFISESVISYISWDLITPVIRLITVRADIISSKS